MTGYTVFLTNLMHQKVRKNNKLESKYNNHIFNVNLKKNIFNFR